MSDIVYPARCPECVQGKHVNCTTEVLDANDEIGPCRCSCRRLDGDTVHEVIIIEYQPVGGEWRSYGQAVTPDAAQVVLDELREASAADWRAIRVVSISTVLDL